MRIACIDFTYDIIKLVECGACIAALLETENKGKNEGRLYESDPFF